MASSCLLALGGASCVANPEWQGPLPVRNQHPAQLTVMHMAPAPAAVLPAEALQVRLDSAYTSLFLFGQQGLARWEMDGEYLRVAPSLRAGLGMGLELAVEVPFAHTSGGFLDSFIIDFHEVLGMPDQSRDTFPKNQYSIEATRSGEPVWSVEKESLELLDVPLQLTQQILAPADERLGLAVRGGVELPTGDDERGYGSGGVDSSLGVVAEYRIAGVALYGHAQHTFASTPAPAKRGGLEFADVTSAGLGTEVPLTSNLHALLQVEWETSTLRHFGLGVTDRQQWLLWGGGRWMMSPALGLEIGIGEDLVGLVSPDFTAWLGMVWNPGRAPARR